MDLRLLEKFFANRCTPDEVAEVLRWFSTPDDKSETLAQLEDYWKQYRPDEELPRPTHQTLRNLHREIDRHERERPLPDKCDQPQRETDRPLPRRSARRRTSVESPRKRLPQYLNVAAIIALAVVGSLIFHQYQSSPLSAPVATVVKATAPGQKHTFQLPDGTRVRLNADSKLTYSATQDNGPREVSLTGEAFFEVAHDAQRPFTVTARGVATTALGTSFNVRAYDTTVAVALVTGRVRVAQQPSSAVLVPGERIRYFRNAPPRKDRYDALRDLAWREGTLHFSQATLPRVVQQLERWYGVTVTTEGQPVRPWNYTGTFTKESLENVLTGVSYTHDFTFRIREKDVILTFN